MILLDTHVLIWMSAEPRLLSARAREAIREARQSGPVNVAAITLWEVAMLAVRGRIQVTGSVQSIVSELSSSVVVRPITPEIAAVAASFPSPFPKDPCDRLIGATALVGGLKLVTADESIRTSRVLQTVW